MTEEKQKCSIRGCENDAIEFFGDIDHKRGYCAYHASLVEQYAESLGDDE